MNDEEIFNKALIQAKKNGFKGTHGGGMYCEMASQESEGDCVYTTIFDHNFAKAFWGDKWTKCDCGGEDNCKFESQPIWQYHLQQMVLKKEPLKYLERFIN
jgi:hypothetical protein